MPNLEVELSGIIQRLRSDYEWGKRTKFLLAVLYGSPRWHLNSFKSPGDKSHRRQKSQTTKAQDDKSPRRQNSQTTKAPGIAILGISQPRICRPPPPPQFWSGFYGWCAMCWNDWKIKFLFFPIFVFRVIEKNSSKIGVMTTQKWP